MEICHPEILKTERFGRVIESCAEGKRCTFCGEKIFDDAFDCDIIGRIFCIEGCKEKFFIDIKRRAKNE